MRWLIPLLFLFAVSCDRYESRPYSACDTYQFCDDPDLDCVGFRCMPRCSYEGDCPLGERCDDGHCVEECEEQSDCRHGTCASLDDGRRGNACRLTGLPDCDLDEHCGYGICVDGTCESRCEWDGACGAGQMCNYIRDWYGHCVDDPDYVPPANCAEAPYPDRWCYDNEGPNSTCDHQTAECIRYYPMLLIRDVTQECDTSSNSPGADIVGVRLLDVDGIPVDVQLYQYEPGEGSSNQFDDWLAVQTEFEQRDCSQPDLDFMSLGCGGHILVRPTNQFLFGGWTVDVWERTWCAEDGSSTGVAQIVVCEEFSQDPAHCDVVLGRTDQDTSFVLP